MLIDSHCHLDFPELATDESGVLARARTAGIAGLLTIGTRLDQFERVRAIAERHGNVWCSVGVHPHEAQEEGQRSPDRLIEATRHPKVVGIGETYGGLRTIEALNVAKPFIVGLDPLETGLLQHRLGVFCIGYEMSVPPLVRAGIFVRIVPPTVTVR